LSPMLKFSENPLPRGGFTFDLCARNDLLEKNGLSLPKAKKTGTTIVGIICKDAVILGADTRATEDTIVCDKNADKIHYIAPNIYCCGAGTSADTAYVTELVSSQLELHRLSTGRASRIVTCLVLMKRLLFRYQGHVSAALILGGVDVTGCHLHTIYPHGSTDSLPYVTMGSGSLAAMAVFESRYKENLSIEEGKSLVHDAVSAGIFNDLGSGSTVDLTVITKDKVDRLRGYARLNPRKFRKEPPYSFPAGFTPILSRVDISQEEEFHA